MAGVMLDTKAGITLKGSTDIVVEFFDYGIHSILYQRGVYPPESFTRINKYGLTLLLSTDETLKDYLKEVLQQIKEWLLLMTINKLVLVIKSIDSNEVLERWQFDVECEKDITPESVKTEKTDKEINKEIGAVIRQITASVTFLPLLETACSFDLLVYTAKDLEVPEAWGESGPNMIANSSEVRLRSFSTTVHKVDAMVAYKND